MPNVIRRYVGFQIFFNLLLWIPVFYEAQKRLGLTDPEIFGIQSIYYVVFCFLEVPTGWIADRFGYRFSMRLGAATLVAANLLPIATPDYVGFLSHFLLIALARSLISGAGSAYLYEYLKERGEQASYKQIEGDARFYSLVGRVACWAVVGYLMEASVTLPYWLSALNALVAFGFVVVMPHVSPRAPEAAAGETKGGNVLLALRSVARTPYIVVLMAQGVGIFVLVRILQVNLYQPVLGDKTFDVTSFGWIMSLMTVFEAVGSKLAHRVKARVDDLTAVTASTLVLSACLALIAATGQGGALVGFCVFSLAAGIAFPVQKQVMNDAVTDSRFRATVLSLESILDRALCAVAVLPLGGLVKNGRLDETLLVSGALTAVFALVIQILARKLRPGRTAPVAQLATQLPEEGALTS